MGTLHQLKEGGSKAHFQVLKKIEKDRYIIGDSEDIAGLHSKDQILEENKSYQIIKPIKMDENVWEKSSYKIQGIRINVTGRKFTKKEEMTIRSKLLKVEETGDSNNSIQKTMTFQEIDDKFEANQPIPAIPVLIANKSNTIKGKYSEYKIIGVKDSKGQRNTINMYHKHDSVLLEVENIVILKNITATNFKKEDDKFRRLKTFLSTRVCPATEKEAREFKDVPLGDIHEKRILIGNDDTHFYNSCQFCRAKVTENEEEHYFCKKCLKNIETPIKDYCVKLYMEAPDGDIENMLIFQKTLIKSFKEATPENLTEIFQKNLGKTFLIDYNKHEDEKSIIIEKINIVN